MSQHRLTRLAFGPLTLVTGSAPGAPDTAVAHTRFSTGWRKDVIDLGRELGGLGTFSHSVDNTRENVHVVQPSGEFVPSVAEWQAWLEFLLNGTPSGTGTITYPLGTVSTQRNFVFDRSDDVFALSGVVTAGFDVTAEAGGEVKLAWRGVGVTGADGGAWPVSPTAAYLGTRFLMGDAAVTVGGTSSVKCRSIRLSVDYGINGERYYSSFTTATPMKTDHNITLGLTLPLREHAALWDAGASDTGVQVVLQFAYSNRSLTFTLPAVRAVAPPPESAAGDPEIMVPWEGRAYLATGVTTPNAELSATLDTTA